MKILICGSRGWRDVETIDIALVSSQEMARKRGEELVVVHGDAPRGADRLADRLARQMTGVTVKPEPADWDRYGKGAGHVRNQKMLDDHPDIELVYAFRSTGRSNGTDDMVSRANKAGKRVLVITE